MSLISPYGRGSYAWLLEPQKPKNNTDPNKKLMYSVALVVPKTTDITEVNNAIWQELHANLNVVGLNMEHIQAHGLPPNFRFAIQDGDNAAQFPKNPEYRGNWIIKASSPTKPQIVVFNGRDDTGKVLVKPLTDERMVYPGVGMMMDINPYVFNKAGGQGAWFGLNSVMIVDTTLERFDNKENADEAFGKNLEGLPDISSVQGAQPASDLGAALMSATQPGDAPVMGAPAGVPPTGLPTAQAQAPAPAGTAPAPGVAPAGVSPLGGTVPPPGGLK